MKKTKRSRSRLKAPDAVIALDLGRHSIKAVLMRRNRGGCSIEGHQIIPGNEGNKSAVDQLEQALTALQGTFLKKTRNLAVGIGAHECRMAIRDLPAADSAELRKVIRKATSQIFKEDLENFTFDCSGLRAGRTDDAPATNAPVTKRKTLITAIPREQSEALQKTVAKHKCKLWALTVSQVSAIESIAEHCGASSESVGTLDIGLNTSTLSIIRRGELVFVRTLEFGSAKLTDALAQRFNVSASMAENLKQLLPKKVEETFIAAMTTFANELRSSIDFFEHNHESHLKLVYVTGATAKNPQILDLLQRETGLKMKEFSTFPSVPINTGQEEAEAIKGNFVQLIAAVTEGERLLQSCEGLNLLSEQNELLLERNTNSLRGVFAVCAALVTGVLGWGAFQHVRANQLEQQLNVAATATSGLARNAELATSTSAKAAEVEQTLRIILAQANARFLFAPVLGAMQEVPLDQVELLKLKIEEEVVQTAVSRAYTNKNRKVIPAQPARTIQRNTLVLEAKQAGSAPVESLVSTLQQQRWFRENLRPVDPVLLKELISQEKEGTKESLLKVEAYAEKDLK